MTRITQQHTYIYVARRMWRINLHRKFDPLYVMKKKGGGEAGREREKRGKSQRNKNLELSKHLHKLS